MSLTVKQMLGAAHAAVPRISAEDARAKMSEGALLLDIRDAPELEASGRADPEQFGGGVGVDDAGQVVSFDLANDEGVARRRVFAGAHVIEPRWLEGLSEGPAGFIEGLYLPMLERGGRIAGVETRRPWHDLGTPERYRRAVLDFVFRRRPWSRRWAARAARVDLGAQLSRSAVENGAEVEAGARLRQTVVLPGAKVGRDAFLKACVVGFGAQVPAGSEIAGQLITPPTDEVDGGSRLGDIQFTPLAG